jgi:hypothetical protein
VGKVSKVDRHVLDPIVRIFGLKRFCLPASAVAGCIGIYFSIHCDDWQWLSRFGSLIAVFGLFLTMSPVFVRGIYRSHSQAGLFARKDFSDGSTITTTLEDRRIGTRVTVGIVVAILGTIINAFGDLVGLLH